jgi:anti-sigma regulatory factor (Ser/Thr protein kinase)
VVVDDGAGGSGGPHRYRTRVKLRHPARAAELRRIRRGIAHWAGRQRLPDDVVDDLQLAVGEAVANGVEHAYRSVDDTDTVPIVEVELELRLGGMCPGVAVTVADHGRWRPAPVRAGYRGRGLALIEQLTRGLTVSTSGQGTRVWFEVPLPRLQPVGGDGARTAGSA